METKNVTNRYVCKRLRLLTYLKRAGYEPYDWGCDFKNPNYNVFYFDRDQPGFEDALSSYFDQRKAQHE